MAGYPAAIHSSKLLIVSLCPNIQIGLSIKRYIPVTPTIITINTIKKQAQIPLIALEPLDEIEDLAKFKNAYLALDKAQISIIGKVFNRAISELNEAKFNLKDLIIGKKYMKQVDDLVKMCQEKLGRKPAIEAEAKEEAPEDVLKARIARRREERRKKVLDLLKKSKEDED